MGKEEPKQENCTFCEGTGQIVSSTTTSGFKTCDCIIIPQEEPKLTNNCPKCGMDLAAKEQIATKILKCKIVDNIKEWEKQQNN